LLTESLLLQVTQLALKAGPNVGAPPATQTSMLPGKIRHLDPSSNSTRWLSECARIFIAVHRNSCAAREFKDGFSCDEMTGHGKHRNAGENKQKYCSSNPSI